MIAGTSALSSGGSGREPQSCRFSERRNRTHEARRPGVIGALILEDLVRFLQRFVILNQEQAEAIALWIAHAFAIEAFDSTPYLWITSAEKRSGKSRLLEVLELL